MRAVMGGQKGQDELTDSIPNGEKIVPDAEQQEYIEPLYQTTSPNEDILLSREPVAIRVGEGSLAGEGKLFIRFLPAPHLICDVEGGSALRVIGTDWEGKFELVDCGVTVDGLATNVSFGTSTAPPCRIRILPPNGVTIGDAESPVLAEVTFHVVNFFDFWGAKIVSHDKPEGGSEALGKLELRAGDWRIMLNLLPGARENMEELKGGGYAITHAGTIEREDGNLFAGESVHEVARALRYFLSFARGFWSGPILLEGVDASGETKWKRWRTPPLDSWQSAQTWFCHHHASTLKELFPSFWSMCQSDTWREPVQHGIYWYLAANMGTKGTDARLILAQAALELLSWNYAVVDQGLISRGGFNRLRASDEIRMLLSSLGIPTRIPKELAALSGKAKAFNWGDGPHALTEIRNSYVHPESKHDFGDVLIDASQLSLWYVELSLLRLLGYSGDYSNRLEPGWVGEVEAVPWAAQEESPDGH